MTIRRDYQSSNRHLQLLSRNEKKEEERRDYSWWANSLSSITTLKQPRMNLASVK